MALARRIASDLKAVQEAYPDLLELDYHKFQLRNLFFELPPAYPFKMPSFWTETQKVKWDEMKQGWTAALRLLPVLEEVLLLVNNAEGARVFPVSLV